MTLAALRGARSRVSAWRAERATRRLVEAGLVLGDGAWIARDAYIDPGRPWLIAIGRDSTVGPRAMIFAHDASLKYSIGHTRLARVDVGDRVFVGAGAIVLPGTGWRPALAGRPGTRSPAGSVRRRGELSARR